MKKKSDIVTFKVDRDLWEAIQHIPNRSRFIRSAIMTALESTCPLCQGTGIMSPSQRRHWDEFQSHHRLKECPDCEELYLVCRHDSGDKGAKTG